MPAPMVVASPPVVVVEQPAYIAAPAPVLVSAPPTVIVESPTVVTTVNPLDPVSLAAQRLQSVHGGTRREAAESLGLLGDSRAIAPLADALKNDWNAGVRIACAESLGQIGGPEAETILGRCVVYEKKDSVREAAARALHLARMRPASLAAAPTTTVVESRIESIPRSSTSSRAPVSSAVPPPPAPGVARPLNWKPKSERSSIPLEGPSEFDLDGDELDALPLPPSRR